MGRKRIEGTEQLIEAIRQGHEPHHRDEATGRARGQSPRRNRGRIRPASRHARRDDTDDGTGKLTTGKQAGGDARHAIIIAARASHDPEGGGLNQASKSERAGERGQGERKERHSVIAFSFEMINEMNSKQERQNNQSATASAPVGKANDTRQ